ncbi:hypothetical protein [Pacificibacter marinus]|uniref:hypothetical protein n=1 Tax=Pacificibacter marinus TaxID=658057 RepID=UPI001C069215|nr:hypothetical protein [Pacificibacter marinus]MBU2868466.1 hypothetical protein [Pacificibacter marinus]
MKNVTLVAALAASVAFSANAMTTEIDTDGDGIASLSEMLVSHPELTEDLFREMDTDGDGFIDDDEMAVANELGMLVDPDIDI